MSRISLCLFITIKFVYFVLCHLGWGRVWTWVYDPPVTFTILSGRWVGNTGCPAKPSTKGGHPICYKLSIKYVSIFWITESFSRSSLVSCHFEIGPSASREKSLPAAAMTEGWWKHFIVRVPEVKNKLSACQSGTYITKHLSTESCWMMRCMQGVYSDRRFESSFPMPSETRNKVRFLEQGTEFSWSPTFLCVWCIDVYLRVFHAVF
jgi:hypothetical protein